MAAAIGVSGSSAEASSGTNQRLRAFSSCPELLTHVKQRALPLVGAYGMGASPPAAANGVAAPAAAGRTADAVAGVDYSTTNVQEEGVDEPDIVKTNGSNLFVVRGNALFAVDVGTARPKVVGSLPLGDEGWGGHELLLHGDRLLVLTRGGNPVYASPGVAATRLIAPVASETTLTEISVSNPSELKIVRSMKLDADYVSARLVGATARIVTVSRVPQRLAFAPPNEPTAEAAATATRRNRNIVRASRVRSWLPALAVRGRRDETLLRRSLVACSDVRRPVVDSGLGLVTVLTIDLKKGLAPIDSDAILTDASTVYASTNTLYVATQRWHDGTSTGDPPKTTTAIHAFDISDPDVTTYRGSGAVAGYLFGQWALSEHEGTLRVASTEEPTWWNPGTREESESFVTALRMRDGALSQIGRVGGLGKGERVFAVRFIGEAGYVVTFRRVDPLYTLDLADPVRPVISGELKILGYSAYLHPIAEGLLLGVGQDATVEGRTTGTQLSLFDVSNARQPVRLQHWTLGSSWSEVETDHHAFLWWPREKLAVLPVNAYDPASGPPFSGAAGFRVSRSTGIEEVLRISHQGESGNTAVRRSLVVRDRLLTVSDSGVRATALSTLSDAGWAVFPPAGR
jgi:uncharacterized secreted protein with C-terminal beta-propeller domain